MPTAKKIGEMKRLSKCAGKRNQQQIINKIWAQAGMATLPDIANIYPRMTSIHDSSLFDDSFAMDFINYCDKIIYCAMYLYVCYINEATNLAESQVMAVAIPRIGDVRRMKMR